jgi:hypothetical protein
MTEMFRASTWMLLCGALCLTLAGCEKSEVPGAENSLTDPMLAKDKDKDKFLLGKDKDKDKFLLGKDKDKDKFLLGKDKDKLLVGKDKDKLLVGKDKDKLSIEGMQQGAPIQATPGMQAAPAP